MAMVRLKMIVSYDGSAYCGWQRQRDPIPTVQSMLEKATGEIVNHPVTVLGSSRTDTGVHARGQVAQMNVDTHLDPRRLRMAINSRLPPDIVIHRIEEAEPDFDIRQARSKRYRYVVWNQRDRSVFYRHYVYHFWHTVDLARMQEACGRFVGRHDFAAFQGAGGDRDTTEREIFHCGIHQRGPIIIFAVEGSGFLYNMVRTMVGTVLEIGRNQGDPAEIDRILASKNRALAGPCAPASGLCLEWIRF